MIIRHLQCETADCVLLFSTDLPPQPHSLFAGQTSWTYHHISSSQLTLREGPPRYHGCPSHWSDYRQNLASPGSGEPLPARSSSPLTVTADAENPRRVVIPDSIRQRLPVSLLPFWPSNTESVSPAYRASASCHEGYNRKNKGFVSWNLNFSPLFFFSIPEIIFKKTN